MRHIIIVFISFIVLLGCAAPKPDITTGEFKLYTTVVVTDDWCYMPDKTPVNGVTKYNTKVRSISTICISRKSDDPERTLKHELEHAWRNAVGLDALAGHTGHCTGTVC